MSLERLNQEILKKTEIKIRDVYSQAVDEINEQLADGKLTDWRAQELKEIRYHIINELDEARDHTIDLMLDYGRHAIEVNYEYDYQKLYNEHRIRLSVPALSTKAAQEILTRPIKGDRWNDRLYFHHKELAEFITKEMAVGAIQGRHSREIAQRIVNKTDITYKKAITIVRTDGTRIAGEANHEAREDIAKRAKNYDVKTEVEWSSATDSRVRNSHADLNGKRVLQGKQFTSINGHKTYYPGGFGVAEEDINCRCVATTKFTIE